MTPLRALDADAQYITHDPLCPAPDAPFTGPYDPAGPLTRASHEAANCLCPLLDAVRADERSRHLGW